MACRWHPIRHADLPQKQRIAGIAQFCETIEGHFDALASSILLVEACRGIVTSGSIGALTCWRLTPYVVLTITTGKPPC
jgi:hypothetical protein